MISSRRILDTGRPRRALSAPVTAGILAVGLGLLLNFTTVLLARFDRMPGGRADRQLLNFLFEHSWGWLNGSSIHRDFWSPGFFFPTPNVLAYSDVVIAFAPLYWPWRAIGMAHDVAFTCTFFAIYVVNFLSAYVLLAIGLRLRWPACTIGAYVLAFSSSRLTDIGHAQNQPMFFIYLSLTGLLLYFRGLDEGAPNGRRRVWIVLTLAPIVAQFWGGFYFGFFYVLCLLAALLGAGLSRWRSSLVRAVRRDWPAWVGIGALCTAGLLPVGLHYLDAATTVGTRGWKNVQLPEWHAWLLTAPENVAYGWIQGAIDLADAGFSFGPGLISGAVMLCAFVRFRDRAVVRLCTFVTVCLVLLTTRWGDASPWWLCWNFLPGADALRAVGRIVMFLTIPAGLGVALVVDRSSARRRWSVVIGLLCCLEQTTLTSSASIEPDRRAVQTLTGLIDPRAPAFLVTHVGMLEDERMLQTDAMWASSLTGVPTVNGYSGNEPKDWILHFHRPDTSTLAGLARLSLGLRLLAASSDVRARDVQIIPLPSGYRDWDRSDVEPPPSLRLGETAEIRSPQLHFRQWEEPTHLGTSRRTTTDRGEIFFLLTQPPPDRCVLTITLDTPIATAVRVSLDGQLLATLELGDGKQEFDDWNYFAKPVTLAVPSGVLFEGMHWLEVAAEGPGAEHYVRFWELRLDQE